jgi:hypothetical protein
MKNFNQFREETYAKAFLVIAEKEMSASQMKKREEIAQSMDDEDFKKRYGKDWMSVKMATATKQAMKEDEDIEEEYIEHMCAKHVYHDVFGEGVVVEGEHDVPDEDGFISWYTVEFPHGKETVYTEDVMVMHERYHGHMMKKKKMREEVEELDELDSGPFSIAGRYVAKASKQVRKADANRHNVAYQAKDDGGAEDAEYAEKNWKEKTALINKRTKGIRSALKRVHKEEVEDVEETVKHPNQQVLDVHEPEKDELTAKDFEMLRKMKKAKAK